MSHTIDYLIEYRQVFDGEQPTVSDLLQGISRSMLLKTASFFLGFANIGSKFAHYKDFLEMFFAAENSDMANDIFEKVRAIEEKDQRGITFVSPQSILQLFEFAFNNLDDSNTQSSQEIEVSVFKAIVLLNQVNNQKQEEGMAGVKDEDDTIKLPALSIAMSYPNSEFINYEIAEVLLGQFVRAIYLFEFLEENEHTKVLLSSFLDAFECEDWREYLKTIFSIALVAVNKENEGVIDISITANEHFEKTCSFIDKLILSQEELMEEGYDFRSIRSSPLYRIEKGIYRVVYPLFLIELIFKGLYFKLREIHDGLPKGDKVPGSNFRSFYCDYFSEQALLYKTLQAIYGRRNYIQQSGAEIKAQFHIDAEPDYYIRNGNYVFLFESKDILINGSIKETFDYTMYREEFSKKLYYETAKNGSIEKKAVLQLVNNIERLLKQELPKRL